MSDRGFLRKMERGLYLSERELEKAKTALSDFEKFKFGKWYIGFHTLSLKVEQLEFIVKIQKSNIDFWEKAN